MDKKFAQTKEDYFYHNDFLSLWIYWWKDIEA